MHPGIFAKTFPRPTLDETLDAVRRTGLRHVQFNLACAGLPTMPEALDPGLCDRIAEAHARRGLVMAAVSGTFNMAHPDPAHRRSGLRRLRVLAGACARLGTRIITVCTGTRDPEDMWRPHPDNGTSAAWADLASTMAEAVAIAEDHRVVVAFEPEVANVVDSAAAALQLIDLLGGPRPALKVVMDPANLFRKGDLARMRDVLDGAFALLGPEIAVAHAKDLIRDGAAGDVAAGRGRLDYEHYVRLLRKYRFNGPLILHGLHETEAAGSVAFLRRQLAAARVGTGRAR